MDHDLPHDITTMPGYHRGGFIEVRYTGGFLSPRSLAVLNTELELATERAV